MFLQRAVWWITVPIGIIAVLWALVYQTGGIAVAIGILTAIVWIGIGCGFGWVNGVARISRRHLAVRANRASTLDHHLDAVGRVNVLLALEQFLEEQQPNARRVGVIAYYTDLKGRLTSNQSVQQLEWESLKSDSAVWRELPKNAVYFLRIDDVPFVAQVAYDANPPDYDETLDHIRHKGPEPQLQIVARTKDDCVAARGFIMAAARTASLYRGKTVRIRPGTNRREPIIVDFTEVSPVSRDDIVLADSIFDTVERTAIRLVELSEVLTAAGHRTRTAILMHGPPGTGKTLLTRYLMANSPNHTKIVLNGFQRGHVREAFRLARYCEPSLIILEDVDLIAVKRQRNSRGTTALHELLDELDGLVPESQCAVLMTTNRPEILEPALASRPGRVTQAIEFPMPNADARHQLLTLFTRRVESSGVDLGEWSKRTDGASPAFLEELVRRAIIFATESTTHDSEAPLRLSNQDFENAIQEIVTSGGALTRNLLGYAAGDRT